YASVAGGLLFGSEPKAILASPLFEPTIDEEGMAELFGLAGAKTPGHAIFRSMREVRPGHVVEFSRRGLRERRYWQLVSRRHEHDETATAASVRELLDGAVGRQLVADVPLCTLLSGGVDSSAI